MLLRCESLEPPMSQMGQKRKGSQRAYSVRITPKKRTSLMRSGTSDLCHNRTSALRGGTTSQGDLDGSFVSGVLQTHRTPRRDSRARGLEANFLFLL